VLKKDARPGLCLAMDIGGTNIRAALVEENGTIVARRHTPCLIGSGLETFLDSIRGEIEILRHTAALLGKPLLSLGCGIPGLVDPHGLTRSSVNLTPLEGRNLRDFLTEMSGLPVSLMNDANAAALAEWRYGAGRPHASLLQITLGTGVGSGLILNDRLWTGIDGIAAEYGHATVEPDGYPCPCGNRGCLEQYASATAIARLAHERMNAGATTALKISTVQSPDAAEVAKAAAAGDRLALSCFATAGRYLGIAAATVINLLNLEAVIIGGGVAQSFALMEEHITREINSRAFRIPAQRAKLMQSELGDDAGLLGAAAAGWNLC